MNAPHPDELPCAPLLEIDGASVMRGDRLILDRFSLRIDAGEHTAILGANGAGKSTLVRLITRELYPLARKDGTPSMRVFGRDRWHVSDLRGLLGIVSPSLQDDCTSDATLEVSEAVLSSFFAARRLGLDHRVTDVMRERADEALAHAGATHLLGRRMASLSTGEARRVLIARALVHRPRALLLDEPCAGLDMASRRRFLESLRGLARTGTTLLLVTHHIEEVLPEIERVVLLRDGQMLRQGDKADVLTDNALSEAFGMPVRVQQNGDYYSAAVM
ncbi:ATP-binding cassette domain-containing protein [Dyella jiangningensis]|uniref:ABC transporter ATP-binding protein n=1 Tax=Dyella jiangningensis TaxID=1379159 RepID=UPI00240F3FB3|nr:ATP-binding cassette domain-containing protein [Dyella jiangningensis]MDG2537863.1 ATP-binding cassette domain-containing protein [Dyella jiangningensis]